MKHTFYNNFFNKEEDEHEKDSENEQSKNNQFTNLNQLCIK